MWPLPRPSTAHPAHLCPHHTLTPPPLAPPAPFCRMNWLLRGLLSGGLHRVCPVPAFPQRHAPGPTRAQQVSDGLLHVTRVLRGSVAPVGPLLCTCGLPPGCEHRLSEAPSHVWSSMVMGSCPCPRVSARVRPCLRAGWGACGSSQAREEGEGPGVSLVLTDCVNSTMNAMRKQEEWLLFEKKEPSVRGVVFS